MKHLVTGAAGFIGANLVARLKAKGDTVFAVDVKETPERQHLYQRADGFWLYDLRSSGLCHSAIRDVDWVWHLAADHGGAGYFYSDADFKAANNNLTMDRNVLQAAMRNEVKRIFFASSACTYPVDIQGVGARALRESDLGRGEGEQLYGMAKRMSTLLMEGAREHGIDARCGVFHTIYGPTQDTEEPRAKFPTAICRKIIEATGKQAHKKAVAEGLSQLKKPGEIEFVPKVEIWGDGTQVRTFLYIEDALDRIETVMRDIYQGPVNVGSDEEVTVQQCADWAAEALGVEPEWTYNLDAPTGVPHRASDNTRWNKLYGEGNLTPAKEGFQRLAKWMEFNADKR